MGKAAFLGSALVLAALLLARGASGYTHQIIHDFCSKANCTDGAAPNGGLVMDAAGNLFGTTASGGKVAGGGFQHGVAFELVPNAGHTRWNYRVLHSFCMKQDCADGDQPNGSLVLDVNGNLYGTTPYGGTEDGGVVFELSPNGGRWTYSVLYHFCRKANCQDGADSFRGLAYAGQATGQLYDGVSPLYGTTNGGGNNFDGTVFRLTLDQATGKWSESALYRICSESSCDPQLPEPSATVTIGTDGTLYTTTDNDGFNGNLVALEPKGNGRYREHTDYTFCAVGGCLDGKNPDTDVLTLDGAGNLYGTTWHGGANAEGTIFEFDPSTSHLTTLYNFCSLANCADGGAPQTGVMRTAAGDLFGTTPSPPQSNGGTAYELDHTGTFHLLYTFCSQANCTDGSDPKGELIADGSGILYGTTNDGGANDGGAVYELVP